VVLISLSAGSGPQLAQAFPVFARPATTISRDALAAILSQDGATLGDARLDVRHARAFSTPLGTGYVVTDTRADLICVSAPGSIVIRPAVRSRRVPVPARVNVAAPVSFRVVMSRTPQLNATFRTRYPARAARLRLCLRVRPRSGHPAQVCR
jgi:hypothetical protein